MVHMLQPLQILFQTSLAEFEIFDNFFFLSEVLGGKQPYLLKQAGIL